MNKLLQQKAALSVCIGEGFLSSFEAGNLKQGDCVKSVQIAGNPFRVNYNGNFICNAEIVVINDLFGLRIVDFNPPVTVSPFPKNTDDVIEILPTRIRLAEIMVSLEELRGISYGSIINLGKKIRTDEDVEFLIAGHVFARGKAVVYFENMGIRITEIVSPVMPESNIRTSGFLIEDELGRIKDYDFCRPDKFTREALLNLEKVHEQFVRNLKIRRNELKDYQVTLVDQCTYEEAVGEINKAGGASLFLIRQQQRELKLPRDSSFPEQMSGTQKRILEASQSDHVYDKASVDFINSMFERYIHQEFSSRPLYLAVTDNALAGDLENNEPEKKYLVAALRGAWKIFADLNFQQPVLLAQKEESHNESAHDMVSLVVLSDPRNPGREFFLVYPYFSLQPMLKVMG